MRSRQFTEMGGMIIFMGIVTVSENGNGIEVCMGLAWVNGCLC